MKTMILILALLVAPPPTPEKKKEKESFFKVPPKPAAWVEPEFRKRPMLIGVNPTTLEGKLIRQQFERDWVAWTKERMKDNEDLDEVLIRHMLPAEEDKKYIFDRYDVKFVETSDDVFFRIGRGRGFYLPKFETSLLEFPNAITFVKWAAEVQFENQNQIRRRVKNDYLYKLYKHEEGLRKKPIVEQMEKDGWLYIPYYCACCPDEWLPDIGDNIEGIYSGTGGYLDEGFLKYNPKKGKYVYKDMFTAGYISRARIIIDEIEVTTCPFDPEWELP